jgi:hypothetical protein
MQPPHAPCLAATHTICAYVSPKQPKIQSESNELTSALNHRSHYPLTPPWQASSVVKLETLMHFKGLRMGDVPVRDRFGVQGRVVAASKQPTTAILPWWRVGRRRNECGREGGSCNSNPETYFLHSKL